MTRTARDQRRSPRAASTSLVADLALLQSSNVDVGFLVHSVDFGQRPVAVTASWAGASTATVHPDAEAGRANLRQLFAEAGPGLPHPAPDDGAFRSPDDEDSSPHLVHAWVMREVGRFEVCAPEDTARSDPALLRVRGDTESVEVTLHLAAHGYAVRFSVAIGPPGSDFVGMAPALAEAARTTPREHLTAAEPLHGIRTYLGPNY